MKHYGLIEIERQLEKIENSIRRMKEARSAADIRDGWEDFLSSFSRCLGKMISLSQRDPRTKAWGHRLKNSSQRDDEGLVFLREARNAAEHGLTPTARFRDPHVTLGDMFEFGGSGRTIVQGGIVEINGARYPLGDFTLQQEDGFLKNISGQPSFLLRQIGPEIRLQPIFSEEKNKEFKVPLSVFGVKINPFDPSSLALLSQNGIRLKYTELRSIIINS